MKNVDIMVQAMTCTGCCACISLCPHGYITIQQGKLGFPVPLIQQCDNCGICLDGCPYANLLDSEDSQ